MQTRINHSDKSVNGAILFWSSEAGAICTITGVQGSWVHLPETMRILRGHSHNHDFHYYIYLTWTRAFSHLHRWQSVDIKFKPRTSSSGNNSYWVQNNHRLWSPKNSIPSHKGCFIRFYYEFFTAVTKATPVNSNVTCWEVQEPVCLFSRYLCNTLIPDSCSLSTFHLTLLPSSLLPAEPPLLPWQHLSPVPWPVDALPQ